MNISPKGFLKVKSYLWEICKCLMSVDTVKRFDRIVAILIQLQSKKIVRAQDLADRFEVSLRTIYRDIRTLEAAGVPIASEAGIGYSIMDGYRLPPIMFTREEAGSFVAAEKLMQKYTDSQLGAYHQSAMFKLKSVLRGAEKEWVSALENHIRIDPTQDLFSKDLPNPLETLFESIAEKKQVLLKYHSLQADQPSERHLEVVGLFHENNNWYVLGYCHMRQDYRQFRTDRMLELKKTQLPFLRKHGNLEDYLHRDSPGEQTTVVVRVDPKVARYLKSSRKLYGFVSEKVDGNWIEMTFKCYNPKHTFVRWYLTFADYAQILQPPELRLEIAKILAKSQEMLSGDAEL